MLSLKFLLVLTIVHLSVGQLCPGEDLFADSKLKNRKYVERQIACFLEDAPCDDLGRKMKREYQTTGMLCEIR